jgi:RND superfamily putative drug exporter
MPSEAGELFANLQPISELYLSPDGTAYRLQAILKGLPTSYSAMDTINEVRDLIKPYAKSGHAVVSGNPVMVTDIRDTMDSDQLRAFALVMGGIFLVLLVMLRSAVAPVYLILTVVLTFTTTLGITALVFDLVLGVEKLTFWMPFFTFVFLVALGIDYSIFLMGRVKEEVARYGVREGVHVAVSATGGIITSAGIILAGTFAAMMSGQIKGLSEIGFAVSFGVLIDTFIVRTMLVPALTTMLGRWAWWPGGVPQAKSERAADVVSGAAETI